MENFKTDLQVYLRDGDDVVGPRLHFVTREKRSDEEMQKFATEETIRLQKILVDVPNDSGISSQQNSNAWINGKEWEDFGPDKNGELPKNSPQILIDLYNKCLKAKALAE